VTTERLSNLALIALKEGNATLPDPKKIILSLLEIANKYT
jgi:hypothetical protein